MGDDKKIERLIDEIKNQCQSFPYLSDDEKYILSKIGECYNKAKEDEKEAVIY